MDMTKKDGGIIQNWAFNTLSITPETVKEKTGIEVKTDKIYILSGYIAEDPTGRFEVGWHFRSSMIMEIDEENGLVETQNTIYRLTGERDPDGDWGDFITKIFY